MPRNVTFMSFLLLGLNRKYVDLFIEKHSKLNAMKLNALLATPCKLSQGTDKLSNVEIYNLINFLFFLFVRPKGIKERGLKMRGARGSRVVILLWLFTYICRRGCITNLLVIYLDTDYSLIALVTLFIKG